MKLILDYYDKAAGTLEMGADIEALVALPVREKIGRFKYVAEDDAENEFISIGAQLAFELSELLNKEV